MTKLLAGAALGLAVLASPARAQDLTEVVAMMAPDDRVAALGRLVRGADYRCDHARRVYSAGGKLGAEAWWDLECVQDGERRTAYRIRLMAGDGTGTRVMSCETMERMAAMMGGGRVVCFEPVEAPAPQKRRRGT